MVYEGGVASRSSRAAATMLMSEDLTSHQPRVFSPQSGLTQRFPGDSTEAALHSKFFISASVGTRGEWMS